VVRGGRRPPSQSPSSVGDFALDALAILDGLQIDRAHVIGSSLGAATGRELAAAAPERVRSLILNGSWVRSDERFRSLIDSSIAAVERVGSLRALIEVISLWVYPPALREDGTVERWLDAVEDVEGAAFRSVRDGLWRRRKRSGRMTQVSYRAGSRSRRCSPWGRRTACCRSSTHARSRR
jgi:pimeloyl-ACP methyl ester carboxylesterase